MKKKFTVTLFAFALIVSASLAFAQHEHGASTSAPPKSQMSGEDMMMNCQKHGGEAMATMSKLEATIAAGKESNDPAKMKAALEQASTQLAEMKHHMSMCPMMAKGGMTQHDHGHMQHGNSSQQQTQKPQ